MQTPGHAILNYAILGGAIGAVSGALPGVLPGDSAAVTAGILLGAILPDVPIVVLYAIHRSRGTPEATIWSVHYQERFWSDLVHGAHSIPLSLAGALVCLGLGAPVGVAFFASACAHALLDLPVHAHDAHRHFLPLSHYRFVSPFSYWDPRFHGPKVALVEALLVLVASTGIALGGAPPWAWAVLALVNVGYAVHYVRTFRAPADPARAP